MNGNRRNRRNRRTERERERERERESILHSLKIKMEEKKKNGWAVVVAQLVERSLPTPEVCRLNPDIGKLYITHTYTVNFY